MKLFFYTIVFLCSSFINAQNESIAELLKKYNNESIPYIQPITLNKIKDSVLILDTREKPEYELSHIKNAIYVGYNTFSVEELKTKIPNNSSTIVVYCSIGARSEDIAELIKAQGYANIYNLYGGIFMWKNLGYKVYNMANKETTDVHSFSNEWRYLLNNSDNSHND